MTQTRGRRTGPKSKGQEGGKTEKFPLTKPSPAYPPSLPHTISPRRLTRIAVSGSGSGRSRRWTAAAALAARRGSSRRRRQRSTTARSASGASMPRRGAQPPKTSSLPFLVCSPAPASSVRFTNFCSIFLPSLFGARRRLLSLKVATFWVVYCILFISDVYHFFCV